MISKAEAMDQAARAWLASERLQANDNVADATTSRRVPGRHVLDGLEAGSGAHTALAAALAGAERTAPDTPAIKGRSRAEIEASTGHPIDVIAIRCSGHAVNGKVKNPRVGYAVRFEVESGWYFGGTLSAALDVEAKSARSPWANAARTESYLAKQESGHERDVVFCSTCEDRFVFADGARMAAALVSFIEEDTHTVTIAELRARY